MTTFRTFQLSHGHKNIDGGGVEVRVTAVELVEDGHPVLLGGRLETQMVRGEEVTNIQRYTAEEWETFEKVILMKMTYDALERLGWGGERW